jgi:Zinc finger, C2H2 type
MMTTRMGPTNTQKHPSSADTVTATYHTAGEHWESCQGDGNLADDDEEDEDEEEEEDADAEAEEIARRLNDQLWAEINKAQAEAAATSSKGTAAISDAPISSSASEEADAFCHVLPDKRVHEALKTMRIILKDIANDPLARSTLSATLIPGPGVSVLDAFDSAVSSNAIPKEIAKPLSHILVSLARSDVLFSSLRHSEESSIQLQLGKGKRQRDDGENDAMNDDAAPPPSKRHSRLPVRAAVPPPLPMHCALHTQLDAAGREIISALTSPASPPTGPPPPPLIASIQFPLHQVFLFAMTAAGPARNMLQEVGGLIQALGVLTGIPIGGPSTSANGTNSTAWGHPGTSVHPCSFLGCGKTFARLYSLRAHTTRVHAAERPFRCTRCPAAFARNHDLKRHERLHEYKAWQCTGCAKAFSRRDALTRHRNAAAARHSTCATADVAEIDVPKDGAGASAAVEDEMRRTRMWYGVSDVAPGATGIILEEGELPRSVLAAAHEAVARLHIVLQACVARALGRGSGGPAVASNMPLEHTATATAAISAVVDTDTTGGQVTLASALARAQAQLSPATGPNSTDTTPAGAVADAGGMVPSINARGSSLYGLSPEQTLMLERAIASAASAAQLQAEAEAALEEEEEAVEGEPSEGEGGGEGGQG